MKKETIINIKKPAIKHIEFTIVGDEPLNIHRLGKKLQIEFEERDAGKPKKSKKGVARDVNAEFLDSLYYITPNFKEAPAPKKITASTRFGFPASGLKKAMVYAARQFASLKMTELRGRFFVEHHFIQIEGKPEIDRFWRRVGGKGPGTGTPDIGTRATFPEWKAKVYIRYNSDVISADSIANLLDTAGFSVGLGEDRPDKSGNTFGMWHVA